MEKQGLLSVSDFRNLFDPPLARDYTYKLIAEKKIRAIQPRKKLYIPIAEIDRFMNSYEVA